MLKIYHNPRCRKSRAGLQYLTDKALKVDIIDYIKNPMNEKQLQLLLDKLNKKPQDIIRTQEEVYKKQFKGKKFNDDEWVKILVEYPNLIQRPIVEKDHSAVLGDPVENLEKFI
ncbi:MAG: arsenate reductase (glutaredoxin) [Bacteroidetes bacterium]|nr:arsenate reductase (glutaredoxin) [Bacteroidota bacterium]